MPTDEIIKTGGTSLPFPGEVLMPLHMVPKGSKLRVHVVGQEGTHSATFHHCDGMYSVSSLDGLPDDGKNLFHLSRQQMMKRCDDDVYELA
jgi:hypothetical protein